MGTKCFGEFWGSLVLGDAYSVLGGEPRPPRTEICGTWVRSDSGLPADPLWDRHGDIRWLDSAQDLCHSKVKHPLDKTDFTIVATNVIIIVRVCHNRLEKLEMLGLEVVATRKVDVGV